ncbi:MAG: hypothetical protein NTX15_03460 [Candidatus Kapabacteria bacterium]|nr:hypothetical protein [Candidatus Kapabacteria bacterium]
MFSAILLAIDDSGMSASSGPSAGTRDSLGVMRGTTISDRDEVVFCARSGGDFQSSILVNR